jgi:hypothetical protein
LGLLAGVGWSALFLRSSSLNYENEALAVLFIGATMFLLFKGLSRRAQIIINSNGILDRRLRIGTVPWNSIKSSKLYQQYGATLILVTLHDDGNPLPKLSLYRRLLARWYSLESPCDIWFDISDLEVDASTMIRSIDDNKTHHV